MPRVTRVRDLHSLLDHLTVSLLCVPIEAPLPTDLSVQDTANHLRANGCDLALVATPELRVVLLAEVRGAVKSDPEAPVVRYARPPARASLVDSSVSLAAVVEILRADPTPLLVVSGTGVSDIVTVSDFAGVRGTAAVLTTLAVLDAAIDAYLHADPNRQREAWQALTTDQQEHALRLAGHAQNAGLGLSQLSFASFGARLRVMASIGPLNVSEKTVKLLIDVRGSMAHGQELPEARQALDALGDALDLMRRLESSTDGVQHR